jgi:hypothetical protein
MVQVKEDITGWRMWEHGVPDSRLIVVCQTDDYIASDGRHRARYLCKCNCGSDKNIIAFPSDIKRCEVKSCGCFQKDKLRREHKKYNTYNLSGEYGIGYCSNTHSEFYFDLEDYDIIKDYCWCEIIDKDSGYRELKSHDAITDKDIRMHQLLGLSNHDHIDRNPLNNKRNNLRKATIQDNNRNRGIFKNNTSGIMGVNWENQRERWRARIYTNKHRFELGFFTNKEDAIRARLHAEKEYFGEFAPQKHLFKEYGIEDELLE